jgi:hypothetical protein
LTLALVMLLGALTLTGFIANSLQQRADESRAVPGSYSPTDGATVDALGWPIDETKEAEPAPDGAGGHSRSRLLSGPLDLGA